MDKYRVSSQSVSTHPVVECGALFLHTTLGPVMGRAVAHQVPPLAAAGRGRPTGVDCGKRMPLAKRGANIGILYEFFFKVIPAFPADPLPNSPSITESFLSVCQAKIFLQSSKESMPVCSAPITRCISRIVSVV